MFKILDFKSDLKTHSNLVIEQKPKNIKPDINSEIKNLREKLNIQLIQITNIIGITVFLCLIIIDLSSLNTTNGSHVIFDIAMALLILVNFILLKITKSIKTSSFMLLFIFAIMLISLIIHGGKNGTGFLWSSIFPIVAFQLKGHKEGLIYSSIFLCIQLLLLFVFMGQKWMFNYYTAYDNFNSIIFRYILIELCVSSLCFFAAKNRSKHLNIIDNMSRQKTNYFINLAHETKTPLTLINSYLEKYINDNKSSSELNFIQHNIKKLQKDMVNFLDKEKLERNQVFYNHNQIVNLSDFLNKKIRLFKALCRKNGISLTKDIKDGIFIKTDPYAIDRIINNLLENAVRYNKVGGKIKVTACKTNLLIYLRVSDSGIGINKEQQKYIFKPFHQISHKKQNIQGIGMGLSIVKGIMDQINGKILLNSECGKGTDFTLLLKTYDHFDCKISEKVECSKPIDNLINIELKDSIYDNKKYNIFVVEDNREMLFLLQNAFSKNYNFYYALNSKTALDKIIKIPKPHIIISDVMMDGLDGFEFYKKLINKFSDFKNIPVIFLTAKSSEQERLKGLSLGAIDYIAKPFSMDELLIKIKSIINNRDEHSRHTTMNIKNNLFKMLKGKICAYDNNEDTMPFDGHNYLYYRISKREREVIQLIKKGLEYKEIANKLNVSKNTIETYRRRIFRKCNIQNKEELLEIF